MQQLSWFITYNFQRNAPNCTLSMSTILSLSNVAKSVKPPGSTGEDKQTSSTSFEHPACTLPNFIALCRLQFVTPKLQMVLNKRLSTFREVNFISKN